MLLLDLSSKFHFELNFIYFKPSFSWLLALCISIYHHISCLHFPYFSVSLCFISLKSLIYSFFTHSSTLVENDFSLSILSPLKYIGKNKKERKVKRKKNNRLLLINYFSMLLLTYFTHFNFSI